MLKRLSQYAGVAALFALLFASLLPAMAQETAKPSGGDPGPLTLQSQGSFFVGGRDVTSDTLSTLPAYASSGTVSVDQMYVHYEIPAAAGRHMPLVLIHGCCLTGKTWETTPDGRMGWDEFFLRKAYPVYVIDQSWRGRSAGGIAAINAVKTGKAPVDQLPTVFAAGREGAWTIFRFGPAYPKTFDGMRYPLSAQNEFWKQMVPDWSNAVPTPNPTVPALSELAQKLNGAVLISHSQSGIYPFQTAALSTKGIAGIVSIEPGACPAATDDLTPYKRLPILVLWGDYVQLSPRWSPRLKACKDFAAAVTAAGGKAQNLVLPDIGIHGNTHMLMQDNNSLQIASMLATWIEQNVGRRK